MSQKILNILSGEPGEGMKELLFNQGDVKAVRVILEAGQVSADCIVDAPVLLFVISGEGSVIIDDQTFALSEGDVTVVPSGINRHLAASDRQFSLLAVQSHQAEKSCGLCALLESCVNLKD
ncbi:MAG TPA: cupin domain-containing protein [Oscillospiraceae bacterium]|nr:cupin domain-containing protein [Oscillospiraceae bacterium]